MRGRVNTKSDAGRRRPFIQMTSILALTGVLVGCGGDPRGDGAPNDLVVGIPGDIEPANFLGVLGANEPVGRLVLEGLVDYDTDSQEYVPWLAESWEFNDDNTELTVKVPDGVAFHNGTELTADDVVYSMETAMRPDSGAQMGTLLEEAEEIVPVDETTVVFGFEEPVGESFLDALVWTRIIQTGTFDDIIDGSAVVGTGPFEFVEWSPGNNVVLEKHEDYRDVDDVHIDNVTLDVVTQSQSMLAALRSGEVDIAHRLVPRDVATVEDESGISLEAFEPFEEIYLGVDVTEEPFDDLVVRQAVAHALDRDRVADQVFAGYATPTALPMPPSAPGVEDADADTYPYDLEKANQLIEEADAEGTTVTLAAPSQDPILQAVSDIVQYNLEEIGLNVEPVAWDAAQVPKNLGNGTTGGLWIGRVASGSLLPGSMAATLLPYRPGGNASNVAEDDYAVLAEDARSGEPEDNQAYTQYIIDEAWHLTLVHTQKPVVSTEDVEGVTLDSNGYLDLVGATR